MVEAIGFLFDSARSTAVMMMVVAAAAFVCVELNFHRMRAATKINKLHKHDESHVAGRAFMCSRLTNCYRNSYLP